VPVVFWILLGVGIAAIYATVLTLVLVRHTRRTFATRPYRVPATVLGARPVGAERLELDLAVAWPGEPVSTVTVDELTMTRSSIPAFEPGMAVSVLMSPDRSWARLDWSQLTDLTGASKVAIESNDWQVMCKTCGFTRSVLAVGGRRYKAAGERTQGMLCPNCDRIRSHRVFRPRTPEAAVAPGVGD
jgi:hypothetical protein